MKILSVILVLFLGCAGWAKVDPVLRVPTVSAANFPVGKTFVWKHLENDQLYSTEKYTVIESSPTKVVFEMSTMISGETQFKAHHRLEANPTQCLEVYKNPAGKKPWGIRLYFWNKDRWTLNEGLASTLAFEEKFNCDAFVHTYMYRTTVFEVMNTLFGSQELFTHRKHVNIESSWFFRNTENAGVMGFKKMSKPYEKNQYTIIFAGGEN